MYGIVVLVLLLFLCLHLLIFLLLVLLLLLFFLLLRFFSLTLRKYLLLVILFLRPSLFGDLRLRVRHLPRDRMSVDPGLRRVPNTSPLLRHGPGYHSLSDWLDHGVLWVHHGRVPRAAWFLRVHLCGCQSWIHPHVSGG